MTSARDLQGTCIGRFKARCEACEQLFSQECHSWKRDEITLDMWASRIGVHVNCRKSSSTTEWPTLVPLAHTSTVRASCAQCASSNEHEWYRVESRHPTTDVDDELINLHHMFGEMYHQHAVSHPGHNALVFVEATGSHGAQFKGEHAFNWTKARDAYWPSHHVRHVECDECARLSTLTSIIATVVERTSASADACARNLAAQHASTHSCARTNAPDAVKCARGICTTCSTPLEHSCSNVGSLTEPLFDVLCRQHATTFFGHHVIEVA